MNQKSMGWILAFIIGTPIIYLITANNGNDRDTNVNDANAKRNMFWLSALLPIFLYLILPDRIGSPIKYAFILVSVIGGLICMIYLITKR